MLTGAWRNRVSYRLSPTRLVNRTRLTEYPHSLSYQATTFTWSPITLVRPASKIDVWGLPMMSVETMSSSTYSNTPVIPPSAAALTAALTSSTVVSLDAVKVKSVADPVIVGTRRAYPSSLPLSSGKTKETAFAAPVEVGTMFTAAARDRRRSRWGPSWRFWSPV